MEFISNSLAETADFAERYADTIREGDVICLYGDLGAGKTTFTKFLCSALGVTAEVTSPTFTLCNEYSGRLRVYHFDMYRLKNPAEAVDSGLDEILRAGDGVCLVEWPENLGSLLPPNRKIYIEKLGETARKFTTEEGRL